MCLFLSFVWVFHLSSTSMSLRPASFASFVAWRYASSFVSACISTVACSVVDGSLYSSSYVLWNIVSASCWFMFIFSYAASMCVLSLVGIVPVITMS